MGRRTLVPTILFGLFALAVQACPVDGATITISYTDRGWYSEHGVHDPTNRHYNVGDTRGPSGGGSTQADPHNFFVFNLSSLSTQIASARLALLVPRPSTPGGSRIAEPTETYQLADAT